MIPSTVSQVVVMLVALVPGITYRAMRVRVTGRNPNDASLSHRALRAFVSSVMFVSAYAICFSKDFDSLIDAPGDRSARFLAFVVVAGGLAVPALVGLLVNALAAAISAARDRMYAKRFDPGTPLGKRLRRIAWVEQYVVGTMDELRPWDARVPGRAPCYVRIRKSDGTFLMGFLDAAGHVSTYPDSPALFMAVQYDVDETGAPQEQTPGTKGIWYQLAPGDIVEFIEASPEQDANHQKG